MSFDVDENEYAELLAENAKLKALLEEAATQLQGAAGVFALQALRDHTDAPTLKGWLDLQEASNSLVWRIKDALK